ncbi:uncharacterized protein LOC123470277 [Daphnia magna]|uniref:uncharacterized protein LOC123470277 n=1 Tax=Daphnia magna TaxID=35525 RepID=UPI001E1BB2DD|nr:uncharacterized protein LOC123470277 [Daphnia magna]
MASVQGAGKPTGWIVCAELRRKTPSERALVAKEKGVCFNCLGGKHRSVDCRSKPACESSGCRARHHSLLHGAERVFPEKNRQRQIPPSIGGQDYAQGPQTLAIAPRLSSDVLLAVVPVRLQAGCRTLDVFALLDTGSQATLLREDAAQELCLKGRSRKVHFGTFHGKDPVVDTRLVDFAVLSLGGDHDCQVSDAFVVPHLNVGQRKMTDDLASFEYLRRGAPVDVFSDNGTHLRVGERELREAVARLNDHRILGVWERLVRSGKDALRAILGQQTVKDETFATVVIEVEALLNNRPLTDLGADPQEFEPLTPNHFLLGRPNPHLPADVIDPDIKCFRRRWFHAQRLVDQVWNRWLREYLPTLTTRSKWTRSQKNLEANAMVLMVDPKSPRGHWPICRVVRTLPGPDGVVRAAEVITKSGKTYTRPVTSLCRFEASNAA